jgi:hypothetical protein
MKLTRDTRLPIFVIPGMPRAGTTFLYHNLQKHPSIFLPYRKEIDYFNSIYRYRGIDWFHSLFKGISEGQYAGDISPACWFEPNTIKYIKDYNPDAKVILSLRDPAVFIVSLFAQKKSTHYDIPPTLKEFIEKGYISKLTKKGKGVRFKFDDKEFIYKVEEYRDAFGKNLLIYDFDFFKMNQLAILRAIEDFLGIEQYFTEYNFENLRINESMRRNIKLLSYIQNLELVRDIVEKYVPRLWTMKTRSFVDKTSVHSKPEDNANQVHSLEDIELARKYVHNSCKSFKNLFVGHSIMTGDGNTFQLRM